MAILLRFYGISIENKDIASLIQKILKNTEKQQQQQQLSNSQDHDYYVARGQKYCVNIFESHMLTVHSGRRGGKNIQRLYITQRETLCSEGR